MARDDYPCFMSGRPDTDWFFREHPTLAQGAEGEGEEEDLEFDDCDVVPIIKREALLEVRLSLPSHRCPSSPFSTSVPTILALTAVLAARDGPGYNA